MVPISGQWRCRICDFDRYHQVSVPRKNGALYLTSFYACSQRSVMFLNPAQWSADSSAPANVEAPPNVITPLRKRRRQTQRGPVGCLICMQRLLIALGVIILGLGLTWSWIKRLPLFRLPGDIVINRPGFTFFLPITTMLLISAVISLIAWALRK